MRTFGEKDLGERRRLLDEAEDLPRRLGNRGALAWVLHMLGLTSAEEGDYADARARLEEGLELNRSLGRPFETANSLADLAFVALSVSRYETARDLLRESLRTGMEIGATNLVGSCLAWISARIFEETASVLESVYRPLWERTRADTRRALGRDFDREWEAGKDLSLTEAAALALGESS